MRAEVLLQLVEGVVDLDALSHLALVVVSLLENLPLFCGTVLLLLVAKEAVLGLVALATAREGAEDLPLRTRHEFLQLINSR